MSVTKLETELLKIKKDLTNVKQVNSNFCKVINELENIKIIVNSDAKLKEKITQEFKEKEIIDIFAGIEKDFTELRQQLAKQEKEKEKVADFVESLRTRKVFSFNETTKTILFLEEAMYQLDADLISLRPQFIGTIDLGEIAITLGLHKTGTGIIVQKELFSEVLALLINKRMFRNIVFETSNAKLYLKSSNELIIESDNENIRKLTHLKE